MVLTKTAAGVPRRALAILMLSVAGMSCRGRPSVDNGGEERSTVLSTVSLPSIECDPAASTLGRAYSDDLAAIADGTFDRGRVVIQYRGDGSGKSEVFLGPIANDYVQLGDLDPLYILPGYSNAHVRSILLAGREMTCDPARWASLFMAEIDERVIDLVADGVPVFGTTPEGVRVRMGDLIEKLVASYLTDEDVPQRSQADR